MACWQDIVYTILKAEVKSGIQSLLVSTILHLKNSSAHSPVMGDKSDIL